MKLKDKIFDFTEIIEWFEKNRVEEPTTKNIAENFKRQCTVYDAFFETYIGDNPDLTKCLNMDDAAYHMLDCQKRMIYLNQRAHGILNPKIKFPSYNQQLEDFFKENHKVKDFIFKYLKEA